MRRLFVLTLVLTITPMGCVSGRVLTEDGNPVVNAHVTIYDCIDTGCYSAEVTTDSTGRYTYNPYLNGDNIPDLPTFSSIDTLNDGMVIVVNPIKVGNGIDNRCYLYEGAAITYIPSYELDTDSGQYYTVAPDIYVGYHLYGVGSGCHDAPDWAPDADGDGLHDDLETKAYGTSPTDADTDDDGLKDGIELRGTRRIVSGNNVDWDILHDMATKGATPKKRDLFVQWNYQSAHNQGGSTVTTYPPIELRDFLKTFLDLPGYGQSNQLTNPDGTNGMRIIVDPGEEFTNANPPGYGNHIEDIGCDTPHHAHVPARRQLSHIRTTVGFHRYNPWNGAPSNVWSEGFNCHLSGWSQDNTQQFDGRVCSNGVQPDQVICAFERYTPDPMNDSVLHNYYFYTFVHEMGHQLGLKHGGNEDRNCKPNYWSFMNYAPLFWNGTTGKTLNTNQAQFSDGANPSINESSIKETDPFTFGSGGLYKYSRFLPNIGYPAAQYQSGYWGWVDWNKNGTRQTSTYPLVVRTCENTDGYKTYSDYNDYSKMKTNLPNLVPISGAGTHYLPGEPFEGVLPPPEYPEGYTPGDEYPFDPDTASALEILTGRKGDELLSFLKAAGIDPEADKDLLRKFWVAQKGTDAKTRILNELYPDGIPSYLSNETLEADVREVVRAAISKEIGYAPEIQFVDCPSKAGTLAKFGQLLQLVRMGGQRTYGATEYLGTQTLEEVVPAIPGKGLITFCR